MNKVSLGVGVWFFFFGLLYGEDNPKVCNVVGGNIIGSFVDRFSENSGHRKELVDGSLYEINPDVAFRVYWLIGEKLLSVEREVTGDKKDKIRRIIFGFNEYLLQVQGYKVLGVGDKVYVVGVPTEKEYSDLNLMKDGEYPKTLVLPDGGGVFFWQAYVDLGKGSVDISFNDEF